MVWHLSLLSCRPRSSTSSKRSNPVPPNCEHPWWTRPSTCFSSKWRLNWNRLKTNWSRPKMNWVPGNLHLIGKNNQNNLPLKKSRLPHAPHSHCRHAGLMVGGKAEKCCTHHETQTLQKDKHCSKLPFVFVLLHCASYISLNHNWKDSMVRWYLCFSSLPLCFFAIGGPEGVGMVPEEVVTHFRHGYAQPAP